MHELSICQNALSQIEKLAHQHAANAVCRVHVQIGPLSGVDADLLANAFPIAIAGSVADGAELVVETLPLRVHCSKCGSDSEVRPNHLACPSCGNWQTSLISGHEIILSSIELEK